jgi:hypothetical protein
MNFLKRNWKILLVAVFFFVFGSALMHQCGPKKTTVIQDYNFDSLKLAKEVFKLQIQNAKDSMTAIIKARDEKIADLTKTIVATKKTNSEELASIPVTDSMRVSKRDHVEGQQAITMLPMIEAKVCMLEEQVADCNKVIANREEYIMHLDSAIVECIQEAKKVVKEKNTAIQDKEKAEKKIRNLKKWGIITTATTGMMVIGMFVVR